MELAWNVLHLATVRQVVYLADGIDDQVVGKSGRVAQSVGTGDLEIHDPGKM